MRRLLLFVLALVACSKSPAGPTPMEQQRSTAAAASSWTAVVDAPDRTPQDRALDPGRKPAEMLAFVDVKPGMRVADLGAGGGYTSELLARAVGPTGAVYAQNPPEWVNTFLKDRWPERLQRAAMKNVVRVDRPFDDPLPPEAKDLDAVVMNAVYHDVAYMPVDRARMLRALHAGLRPGGALVVVDSSARPGSGTADAQTLHRIDEQVVRGEVEKAGFRLVQEGGFLRNPQDARDWNASPGAAKERRGTSDRFALKFIRPEGAAPGSEVQKPTLRLPAGAAPKRVSAELTVIPDQESFTGRLEMQVQLDAPTPLLWLNAEDLEVTQVEPAARIVDGGRGFVGLAFERPLPAGEATLRIAWGGKLSRRDYDGAFRQQENGRWYAITHLEPLGARRVLPCFDEPSFKIPWRFALRVRKEDGAYFNTNAVAETQEPDGRRLVRFEETRPLPSYLLAFGVGPWERVDAGKTPSGAPIGVVVTRGKSTWATYSAESSPRLLAFLEPWFGIPYPYGKLDLIEVPLGTGAMENPGLITFNQRINLARPGEDTPLFKRRAAGVEAHEFAHLWFGDLVTTAWWDDVWLNEAFATWMAAKTIEQVQPDWNEPAARVVSMNVAMKVDALRSARRIRQPIESEGDIKTAFDAITYQKGAAVIDMFEHFVGPDRFRKGVQRYLREHADGNATAKQFLAAISAEAGGDVAPAFSTFLDQDGLPLVQGTVSCEGGKGRVALGQRRYVPLGAGSGPEQLWQIPVCARTDAGDSCTLLDRRDGELRLASCPRFVVLNGHAHGYYRTQLDGPAQANLLRALPRLETPEKQQVLSDMAAAARAGTADYARTLELVAPLAGDKDRYVVKATIELVDYLRDGFVPEPARPGYARFLREVYGRRLDAIGVRPRPGESEEVQLLRPNLFDVLGDEGEDARMRSEARQLAGAWLSDHKAVSPDLAVVALQIAAVAGDRAWFDRLRAAARGEKLRRDRQRILDAMGHFRDPAIAEAALAIVASDEFDVRESVSILWAAAKAPETRPIAYEFLKANFDALAPRLPRDTPGTLVKIGSSFCDEQHREDVAAFFGPRAPQFRGGDRHFAQAMEAMRQCAAFKERAAPSIAAFFQRHHASRDR